MATVIFLFLLLSLTFLKLIIQGVYLFHKLQQVGYLNLKFLKWLESDKYREVLLWSVFELLAPLFTILLFYYLIGQKNIGYYKYFTSSLMIIVFLWKIAHPFLVGWVGPKAKYKKPLVFTPRVIRLFITLVLIILGLLGFVYYYTAMPLDQFTLSSWNFFKFNAFLLFVSVIAPIIALSSNIVNYPIEKAFHFFYFSKAKKKLLNSGLINVGITGSYGKTSVKFFTATILGAKYKTLFTPSSFNTPMGISKIVNSTNLSNYQYFVCEMGADHKGDIEVLCNLVGPDFSIISSIDIQHLETFGSLQNIIKTKISLFKNTDKNGFGIYNYDSEILKESVKNNYFDLKIY
ncbi:MAG TPA: Mur ligase family protein [Spirochaetota bacterium]|nr:Mur ligase family protein [Spirochaetota bacterium]